MYGSKKQSFYGKWLVSASGNNYRYYNNCYYFDYPVENNQCKGYIIVIKNYSLHFCIVKTGRWE